MPEFHTMKTLDQLANDAITNAEFADLPPRFIYIRLQNLQDNTFYSLAGILIVLSILITPQDTSSASIAEKNFNLGPSCVCAQGIHDV
jgi:hypothetical protein